MKKPLIIALLFLSGCVSNRKILKEVRSQKESFGQILSKLQRIDSTYNQTQVTLYRYEKSRIDSTYSNITDAELLRRIDELTKPKPARKN